jgi:hypothetical protein
VQGEGNLPGLATERSESGKPLGLHKRSAAQCGRLGKPLAGASGRSPLGRVFVVAVRQGQALRTGHRSARGVAQDVPLFTAARLEHSLLSSMRVEEPMLSMVATQRRALRCLSARAAGSCRETEHV